LCVTIIVLSYLRTFVAKVFNKVSLSVPPLIYLSLQTVRTSEGQRNRTRSKKKNKQKEKNTEVKKFNDMTSHFDSAHECDRQTDRQRGILGSDSPASTSGTCDNRANPMTSSRWWGSHGHSDHRELLDPLDNNSRRRPCRQTELHNSSDIHSVKWRHISVVAIRSPFCRSRPSYCA